MNTNLKLRLGSVTGFKFREPDPAMALLVAYGGTITKAAGAGFLWVPTACTLPLSAFTEGLWRYAVVPPGTEWQPAMEIVIEKEEEPE